MPALPKQEVERLIRATAREMGADDLADILVATAIAENGLSNTNPGDMGKDGRYHSFGPFHENDGGRGAGLTREQMEDVPAATRRAIKEFQTFQKKYPNADPGTLAVVSQRPAESVRAGYIKRVNDLVGGMNGTAPAASGGNGVQGGGARAGLPQGVLLSSGDSGSPGSPGGPATAGGSAWPLPGGKVSNKFGGPQGRSPGMKGSLPSSNVGVDISGVPAGTGVVAPVSGEVVKVYQSAGVGNADENGGWGGMVLVKGNDGYFHRLSHLQEGSVGVKAGDRVRAGQPVARVGATGNTSGGGKGPFVHVDWEKFQTKSGNPDDRDHMNFSDPTSAGTGQGTSGTGARTVAVLQPADIPQEKVDKDPDVAERKKRFDAAKAKVAKYDADYNKAGQDMQALREKYTGPDGKPLPNGPLTPASQLSIDVRLRPKNGMPKVQSPIPWDKIPGYWEDNPEWIKDKAAWTAASRTYSDLDDRTEGAGKQWEEEEALAKTFESDYLKAQQEARERFAKESKDAADTDKPTYQIDSPSGTILENGVPVGVLPRDAKPGDTFAVPGVGTFLLKPDGSATLIPGTKPERDDAPGTGQRTVETFDEAGKPITVLIGPDGRIVGRYARQPSANDRNRTRIIETFDKDGKPITALVDDDQNGKIISTYPREAKDNAVTAPRDTKFVVRRGSDGKLIVEDNPNYDPSTGSVTGTSSTGRVYRVGADGKAQITDVLTPEERATYDRGKLADTRKTEVETQTSLLDAATKLMDAELKQRQQAIWGEVQKVIADPNATSEQIMGAIQAGAKDATEWTNILRAHVEQRTNEETARHNRVAEGVSVQEADRQLREGLYRDVNETRNQRTNAQRASNEAIAGSGIIGMANSANVLSAMAPQIGTEGIKKIGTQGLGVGAGAIDPVVKSWEEHQAELQKLQEQMPAVRMADPNVKGPSFAMPRGDASKLSVPPPGDQKGIAAIIDQAKAGLAGANTPPAATPAAAPPVDPATANPVPIRGPEPTPTGPVGAPMGLPDQPAPLIFPPTGPVVPGGSPVPEKEKAGIGLGGGAFQNGKIRFRVPQPKKRKVAA